ncbi:MAG: amidohydrolase family protein [Paracoccus sp. (in: a-proteobacteria)]|uniref:amidohydrolase family protein n=1 Tax=Paracoccus sp. TaxID=267 RepID=UPI0026E0216E|nr:amidohydrolase family protein [Paracoccus sp. (in: a-proteobacteria)]MDO5631608.1 amidohydrolase family protein [Paracoccus sp. (in: a-proteobacteria)]
MKTSTISRRSLLSGAALSLAVAAAARPAMAQTAPFSSGSGTARLRAPALACDSHLHIFDTRFPASPHWTGQPVEDATLEAYRAVQKRIGTTRAVIVNPSTYGVDNRCTLEASARLGQDGRAVVVVEPDISEAELEEMAAQGATGVRVNFVTPQSWGETTVDRLRETAARVAPLGWHVQIYARAEQIVAMQDALSDLPVPLVIDHLGRLPPAAGPSDPAFAVIRRLLDRGRTWVKLSGAYLNTEIGPPDYPDATAMARAYAEAAPERVVWGSDWPHRGQSQLPDDAALFDLLETWAPDEAVQHRILVENPAELYQFGGGG